MEFIQAKSIVTKKNADMWFGSHYNMNIYRGCHHGCIYCDSRSSCYHIEDFDRVRAKENTLFLIHQELQKKREKGIIATGAMSDPYNYEEKKHLLTRGALELIDYHKFGVSLTTKSDLVTRDLDVLKKIQKHSPVNVNLSVSTFDDAVAKRIERNVSVTSKRMKALETLARDGIYTGLIFMPILPFITDTTENITKVVEMAYHAGAQYIYPYFGMTLRENQRKHYFKWLDHLYPGMKQKYIAAYGEQYQCVSNNMKQLKETFENLCLKYGLFYQMSDIIGGYTKSYQVDQLSLF